MNLLVIGGGGREHAIAWRRAQSPRVGRVYVAPGNAGTAKEDGLFNVPITAIPDWSSLPRERRSCLRSWARRRRWPTASWMSFAPKGLEIFGPSKRAAQLEASKDFAKAFMVKHGIPTAAYQTFTDAALAHAYIDAQGAPIVIKADGLAAGKGVVVAMSAVEAHEAVDSMLVANKMGAAGARVVIEEYLAGEEASFIVMIDGRHVLAMASSQDHKRLLDGDRGPNTGGMGAYSPAPVLTPELHARAMREAIQPVVSGMEAMGEPYTGFLYAGLMISPDGRLKVLEFNCRMGDPETQPDPDAPQERPVYARGARGERSAGQSGGAMGSARGARRGDGRRRLSRGSSQRRRDHGHPAHRR